MECSTDFCVSFFIEVGHSALDNLELLPFKYQGVNELKGIS